MRLPGPLLSLLVSLLSSSPLVSAATPSSAPKPCTLHSPSTGSFFDLRPLRVLPPAAAPSAAASADEPSATTPVIESWHSRGYDYPANFTLNICGPAVEALTNPPTLTAAEGIPSSRVQNISAFYRDAAGDVYSIGQMNEVPIFRGKKLVLNYTDGSPCPDLDEHGTPIDSSRADRRRRRVSSDDEDTADDSDGYHTAAKAGGRKKNTLLTFHCSPSPQHLTHPSVSFLGTPDHCTYIFEVASRWACPGASGNSDSSGSLGPGGVFGVIFGIAVAAYLVGGCVYQRSVMQQRGWRQVPHYGLWRDIAGFIGDMFTILFSTCTRRLPSTTRLFGGRGPGGYSRLGADDRAHTGRGRDAEAENRLIDQLDEEWED